jgi:hypothetical protein
VEGAQSDEEGNREASGKGSLMMINPGATGQGIRGINGLLDVEFTREIAGDILREVCHISNL